METGRKFYKRLDSATNEGVDYENLIIADFVLKLVTTSSVTNFELSSNDNNFGNLDDVVIEIEENNIKTLYAFQLKYRRNKVLTHDALTARTGKCSMITYFNTFKELKCKQTKCVLFTNTHFNTPESICFKIGENTINVNVKEEDSFLNSGKCYSFKCEDTKSAPSLFPEFLSNFLLFTDQGDIDKTKNHIKSEFRNIFEATNCEYETFLQFINEWSYLQGQKHALNKELMKNVIALILLAPQIKPLSFESDNVNSKEKLIVDAIDNFTLTEVEETVYEDIKSLYRAQNEDFSNIRSLYQFLLEKDADNLSDLDLSKLLWLKNKTPLIVAENAKAYKVIKMCNTKKFIILKSNFTSLETINSFKRLWDLNKHEKMYQDIVTTFSCSLQGKGEITLKDLLEIDDIKLLITTTELVKMIKSPIKIGEDKEKIANHYINRRISRNLIDMNYLKSINNDTLIVIDSSINTQDDMIGAETNKLNRIKDKLGNFNLIRTSKFLKEECLPQKRSSWKTRPLYCTTPDLRKFVSGPDLYLNEEVCTFENFEKISRKNPEKVCHQFRIFDSCSLEWIRSKGSVMGLETFRRTQRKFVQDSQFFQVKPENNINLISSDPGMGKSELLKTLKNNAPTDIWTVYFDSSEISTFCAFLKNGKFKCFEDYLIEHKYSTLSKFEKAIIKALYKKRKVAIFWDALDEISTQNIEVVLELIKHLFYETSYQWVSARCHLTKYLERKLNVLSRKLDQFNENEQQIYIQYRLQALYSPQIITEIFKMISSTVTLLKHNDVLGVPLQIFMLTELFCQDHEKYLQLLQRVFSLTDLYQHIIDQKFDHYYKEKAAVKSPNDTLRQVLEAHKATMFEKYQKAGLKAIIKKEVFKELNINCDSFLKNIQDSSDCIGLITEVTDDFPKFLHNSYAEFFVAKYFLEHQKEIRNFEDVIFDKRHANVRFFFDLLSAKDSEAHKAVLYNNVDLLKQNQQYFAYDDEEGRNVLELACTWGQKFPKLPIKQEENIIYIDNELDVTPETENSDYKRILQLLLNQSSPEDLKTSFNYAKKADCLLPKLMILSSSHQNFAHLKNDEEGVTLLYYSIKLGYDKVVNIFEELPLVKTKTDNLSLLHLAVIHNQELFLRKLLSTELYKNHINDKDRNGATALFKACQNGFFQLCVILLENGASINTPIADGSTPLHTASLHNHQHIVQFLLKHQIEIDAVKEYKITALHAACWNGNVEVAKLLLDAGASPNAAAQDGSTPLYVASRNNHFKVVELLLEHQSVNINVAQEDGATPLFVASQEGHEKNVELLLKKGAKTELCTKTGESPLFVAAQNGRLGIVKELIDAGADVNHRAGPDGWTALEIAIQQGHLEVVKLLLEVKAEFGCSKEEIIGFAMHHQHSAIVNYLKSFLF